MSPAILPCPEVERTSLKVDITGRVARKTHCWNIPARQKLWSSLCEYSLWCSLGSSLWDNSSCLLEPLLWNLSLLLENLSSIDWSCLKPVLRVDENVSALKKSCLWLGKNTTR